MSDRSPRRGSGLPPACPGTVRAEGAEDGHVGGERVAGGLEVEIRAGVGLGVVAAAQRSDQPRETKASVFAGSIRRACE